MLGNKKRLFIAFLLSVTSLSMTLIWYYLFDPNKLESRQFVVAVVESVRNEVVKRPAERLIWQSLERGDGIHHGETIRTRSQSEMKIKFIDGPELKIEPDTLVVITRSEDKIALELVEGGLLSSQSGESQNQFILKSEGGDFNLTQSKVKVSKSKSETLNLNVLTGNVQIEGTGKQIESGQTLKVEKTGKKSQIQTLQLISPEIDQVQFINKGENILFRWLEKENIKDVQLFIGNSRETLKKVESLSILKNSITTQLNEGSYWVQLKSYLNKELVAESSVQYLDVKYFTTPVLIYPSSGEKILNQKGDIKFLWSHSDFVETVHLVIKDVTTNKIVVNEKLKSIEFYTLSSLPIGDYEGFIRVKYFGKESWIESKKNLFSIIETKMKSPEVLSWKENSLFIRQENAFQPEFILNWNAYTGNEIKNYEIEITTEKNYFEKIEVEPNINLYQGKLPEFGLYSFKLKALDKDKNVLGDSKPLQIEINKIDLLAAVQFHEKSMTIISNREGEATVSWSLIEGAISYEAVLLDNNNKVLKKHNVKIPSLVLKELMPGEYQLKVYAVDKWKRIGSEGRGVLIQVPETSGIRAPATRKVKIK